MTADKVTLVIMLYDGILRFNKLAQKAVADGDIKGRGTHLNRSLEIIGELANSLNREEGGEIAGNLSRLYDFCAMCLTEANLKNDASMIEAANKVITELKAGWEAISADRHKQESPSAARSISCGV
ncbi:MAG: flagellar export chaperone FliS [Deltaproteobacteria bacterium RIFCSPLOWO2_02_FULL_55_12]|nr:MAG: flagellar export chaperone FliS [Deltaproteobacteria bacterium RIFCSPLOWO2_02_FULL_55_12]